MVRMGVRGIEESMSVGEKIPMFKFLYLCPHTHTHTCTMIPFELYSLRKASEKWLSNVCRREDGEMTKEHYHSYTLES